MQRGKKKQFIQCFDISYKRHYSREVYIHKHQKMCLKWWCTSTIWHGCQLTRIWSQCKSEISGMLQRTFNIIILQVVPKIKMWKVQDCLELQQRYGLSENVMGWQLPSPGSRHLMFQGMTQSKSRVFWYMTSEPLWWTQSQSLKHMYPSSGL